MRPFNELVYLSTSIFMAIAALGMLPFATIWMMGTTLGAAAIFFGLYLLSKKYAKDVDYTL